MDKAERILFILRNFNKGEAFTVKELKSIFNNKGIEVNQRTLQRDLQLMNKFNIIEFDFRSGHEYDWKMIGFEKNTLPSLRFHNNELLSYHILKAHLKHFRHTVIEEGILELEKKLEQYAPGEAFSSESLYWNKNIGQFDYLQYDHIIRRLIKYITDKQWSEVSYDTASKGKIKKFKCLPRILFEFKGSLYTVVFIVGKNKEHRVLLLQNIVDIKTENNIKTKVPDFNFEKWSWNRFGVFYGELKNVQLLIKKEYVRFFENRFWHSTQKQSYDEKGNMILEMKTPIVPDFVSWIASWGEGITVIRPKELKAEIIKHFHKALDNYE